MAKAYTECAATGMADAKRRATTMARPNDEQSRLWNAMRQRIATRDGDAAMAYLIRPRIVAEVAAFLDERGTGLAVA